MGSGANAGGFAAGFGKGLTNALLQNRQREDKQRSDAYERERQMFTGTFQSFLDNASDDPAQRDAEVAAYMAQFPTLAGSGGKPKKGESPFGQLSQFLGPLIGKRAKSQSATGAESPLDRVGGDGTFLGGRPLPSAMPASIQPPGVTGGTINALPQPINAQRQPAEMLGMGPSPDAPAPTGSGMFDLPGKLLGSQDASVTRTPIANDQLAQQAGPSISPAPPAAARRTLLGVPIMSAEEKAIARVKRAQTILPALQAVDPTATLEDAFSILANGQMSRDQRTAGISAASLFSDQLARRTKELGRPLTAVEAAKERQTWEAANDSSSSLGIYAERAARDLGFPTAEAAAQAGKMREVNERANQLAAGQAGATTTARVGAQAAAPLTTSQRFQAITDLQTAWRKAEGPAREMERQLKLMETGLDRFRKGDKIGGSQAVLVTFQKVLDPQSVVRESEYARTPQGLALGSRLEGFLQRLQEGGAGVPDAELAMMVDTARQFLDGMAGWNDLERERIGSTAKDFGLDPARVFGVADAATKKAAAGGGGTATTPAKTPAPAAGASTGPEWRDGKLYVNGVPIN